MLDPKEAEPVPWRNGAGTTREMAFSICGDGRTAWRISVADLDLDASFSYFPDMDRIFVPLNPLSLTIDGVVTVLGACEQVRFAGESTVTVNLVEATRALNVMTRRGQCRAEIGLRDIDTPPEKATFTSIRLGATAADISLLPWMKDVHD
jgi:environmental stress-induced protein Ves